MLEKRERNRFDPTRNMDNKPVISMPENPSRIIMVFRAVTGSVGGHKIDGFTRRVQRYDPTVGVVGLYDTTKLCYMIGADGIGDFDETIAYLKGMMDEHPGAKLTTVGFSLGGFGALQYGIRLGAERITALNPWTGLTDDCFALDPRGKRAFDYARSHLPGDDGRDVVQLLERIGFDGQINLFYSGGNPGDVFQANRIKDYPFVNLYETDASSHADSAFILLHYGPEYYESLGLTLSERQKERLREKNRMQLELKQAENEGAGAD